MIQHPVFFYIAIFSLLIFLAIIVELILGHRSLESLKEFPPLEPSEVPKVSIVIAARNEEKNIEVALLSVLAQAYRNFEIIVVDDRSTDSTGSILGRMVKGNPCLRVLHVDQLPKGWLGKNHALFLGAETASGDFFLFTDADVVMEATTVSRAVRAMKEQRLDHLTLVPEIIMPGMMLNAFACAFSIFFSLFAKPWKARDPRSSKHVGIGAFNLVRAEAYRTAGTHRAIAMRPDDDMKLGKLIKKHGLRQEILLGMTLISVEWYSSTKELIQGMMKNAFSGVDYRLSMVVAGTFGQWWIFIWPFLGAFLTSGVTRWINFILAVMIVSVGMYHAHLSRSRLRFALGLPLASALFVYIIWKSTLTTLLNNGINWRDTHYSLEELKANKV